MSTVEQKTTERDTLITEVDDLIARDDFNPEAPEFVAKRDRIEELNTQLKFVAEHKQRTADANALDKTLNRAEKVAERAQFSVNEPELSPGEIFTRSEVFTNYPGRGTSSRLEVKTRATSLPGVLADYAGVLPTPNRQTDITPPVFFTLLDFLQAIPASTNNVETVVWENTGSTTALVVSEGSNKPDVEFEPTVVSAALETIAAWTQMTRQSIEDGPAVAARINQLLMREVKIKAEAAAAAALIAADIDGVSGTDLLAAIRNSIAAVQTNGYNPNAVLINPTDWAALDLDVLGSTLRGPVVNNSFWGLTPIVHRAQTRRHRDGGRLQRRRGASRPHRGQPVHHRQPREHVHRERVHRPGGVPREGVRGSPRRAGRGFHRRG